MGVYVWRLHTGVPGSLRAGVLAHTGTLGRRTTPAQLRGAISLLRRHPGACTPVCKLWPFNRAGAQAARLTAPDGAYQNIVLLLTSAPWRLRASAQAPSTGAPGDILCKECDKLKPVRFGSAAPLPPKGLLKKRQIAAPLRGAPWLIHVTSKDPSI